MDRKNFYYRQLVGESDLDSAFDNVANAFKDLVISQKLTGIVSGLDFTAATLAPPQVAIAAGVAFSKTSGRRMAYAGATVSLTTDESSNPIAIPLVTNNDIIVLSLFLEPTYVESDPRTDGYGSPVNYVRTESCRINIVQGTLGNLSATPAPSVPALRSDQVLLADIIVHRAASINYITILQRSSITTSTFGSNTFTLRTEDLCFNLPENIPGGSDEISGSLREAFQKLAQRVQKHHAHITISSESTVDQADLADINAPTSYDAFADVDRPGTHLAKLPADLSVSTYTPTVNVQFREGQEFIGATPEAAKTVLDLDDNNVLWVLNKSMSKASTGYKVSNTKVFAPYPNYRVRANNTALSGVTSRATFENVIFDPVTNPASTHDKLFFNVHNDTSFSAYKWRVSYDTILRNVDAANANLVFGAKPNTNTVPKTIVDDLDAGNLSIDSSGGHYTNIRLNGTDTTKSTLIVSGDNNIIENVIITGASTEAPMILITGRNNIIRNVILRNFGTNTSSISATRPDFSWIYFGPSSASNTVDSVFIDGGITAYNGIDDNLTTVWTPVASSVIGEIADMANQPLAYKIIFTANDSSAYEKSDNANSENTFILETLARAETGTSTFRLLSASGSDTADEFTVGTEWVRCRNLIVGGNSISKIQNSSDALGRTLIVTKTQRYALTDLGAINPIVFLGTGNVLRNCTIENINNADNHFVKFVNGRNKVENISFDGLANCNGLITTVTGENPVGVIDGINVTNCHTPSGNEIQVTAHTSLYAKNVEIDQSVGMYGVLSTPLSVVGATTTTTANVLIEDSRFIGQTTGVRVISELTPTILRSVYARTLTGGGTIADVSGAAIYCGDTNAGATTITGGCDSVQLLNCTFYADGGRAGAIINTSGVIDACTFIGGTSTSGTGIQLFTALPRVQDGTVSNKLPLFISKTLMRWNDANVNTSYSTDEPMIVLGGFGDKTYHPGGSLFVDGLVAMPDNPALSLSSNTILLGVQGTTDSDSSFNNITVDLRGCPANVTSSKSLVIFCTSLNTTGSPQPVVPQSTGNWSRPQVNNLKVLGFQSSSDVRNHNILDLYHVKASNIEVRENNAAQTNNGVNNIVGLYGSSVTDLTCGAVYTHSSIIFGNAPSTLRGFTITGSNSNYVPSYIIDLSSSTGAAGSHVSDGTLDIKVVSEAPLYSAAAVFLLNNTEGSTVLDNVRFKYQTAMTGAFKPAIELGDAPNKIINCEFDFSYSFVGVTGTFSGNAPLMTFTDGTADFQTKHVGQYITFPGATSTGNKGRFLIVERLSSTQVKLINPYGIAESYLGDWFIIPEVITNIKSGTGDSITMVGLDAKITDSAGAFTKNDVGKKLVLINATTNVLNNGEFLITSFVSATEIVYQNPKGLTEAFPGKWFIVGTNSIIQNNTFKNRNPYVPFLTTFKASYVGLMKEQAISNSDGIPTLGPSSTLSQSPGGSLDGTVPGFWLSRSGANWYDKPIWITKDSGQLLVFPLSLPPNAVLFDVIALCQKDNVLTSPTRLRMYGYIAGYQFYSITITKSPGSGTFSLEIRNINSRLLPTATYLVEYESGNATDTEFEGVHQVFVRYQDPETNVIW
jgi:hypothetical protein